MKYTVATTEPMVLSSSAYSKMKMGYRIQYVPRAIIASNLTKDEAISLYDSLPIGDYPRKKILDEANLCVNTCHVRDGYRTNIIENHKGKA
jgi:hypothetical protein